MKAFFFLGTLLLALAGSAAADTFAGAGLKRLVVEDPVSRQPMDAALFYPSAAATRISRIGPYVIAASREVGMASGRYPLIVMSHGNIGSLWSQHDLASDLARAGFIVVVLTHPGDNYQDTSGLGAVSTLYGRPLQVSATISAAQNQPFLADHIAGWQVGFVGFSAGGGTGLLLAGAQVDLKRFEQYCAIRARESVCEGRGGIRNDRPDLSPSVEPRVGALVLMAPLSVLFSTDSLQHIQTPMLLYSAAQDRELSAEQNVVALAMALPIRPVLNILPDAGHFIFLAPCTPELADNAPDLCHDAPGVDRRALHRQISADVAAFFHAQLGGGSK